MIEVSGLTVRFGGVTPLDGMDVKFDAGTCGLIGPGGAGKTTFFNVLSGFVRPVAGSVRAFDEDLLRMAHFRRARWGLRRTFQTEQAIEELSVFENVAIVHEHSKLSGRSRREDVLGAISFVGLEVDPQVKVATLGARDRRLVEVARAVVGKPRVVLLDEPAAGLPDQETVHMGQLISRIPEQIGALVILVDHDMSLVSACCGITAVLDFGKLIASGPTNEVLRDDRVMRAYLGEVTALLGPNGAGKSSLVLALGGMLKPLGGSVLLDGRELAGRRPERIRHAGLAIVPEGRRLLPELTVDDNIRVATYTLPRDEAKAGRQRALELFPELQKRLGAPARALSGGEQQMVVLAQAIVSKPRFVVIDGLSLGLAPVVVQRLIATISAIAESGAGVLLIEQFATVALGLAQRAYVIEGGRIQYSGSAKELREQPELLQSAYLLRGAKTDAPTVAAETRSV